MNKPMKSNKGITLVALSIYIISILLIVGILTSIRQYFFNNIDIIKDTARYASAFDKFNSYFVHDVKNNSNAKVEESDDTGNITIIFEDGTTYTYNQNNQGIYRGKVKIAANVTAFKATQKEILINSVKKQIITIEMIIGQSNKTLFNKKIDYTLRYWNTMTNEDR